MDASLSRRALVVFPLVAAGFPHATPRSDGEENPAPDVPTYRGNAARSGENPGPGPVGEVTGLWQVHLATTITSSPSVVGNVIFVGSLAGGTDEGGAVHAVDALTGIELWRLAMAPGDGILSSPAVADGGVIIASYDGVVVRVDVRDGSERWRFRAESGVQLQSPVIMDGVVWLTDSGGRLYELDAEDGSERWRFISGDGFERSFTAPALAEGILYCVDISRRPWKPSYLHALDAADGSELWTFTPATDGALTGLPVIAGGLAYVATRAGAIYAVSRRNGDESARKDLGDSPGTLLAVHGEQLFIGTRTGTLVSLDARTLEARWASQLTDGAPLLTGPTIAGGTAYVGDNTGMLYAVDAGTGVEQWHANVGVVRSSPAVTGGVIYVGSASGWLRAIGGTGS